MDIASLLASAIAPNAADPTGTAAAVSSVPGGAFADVFAQVMVDPNAVSAAVPDVTELTPGVPLPGGLENPTVAGAVPVLPVESASAAPAVAESAIDSIPAAAVKPPVANPRTVEPKAESAAPPIPPEPPPGTTPSPQPRKEAATNAPNAPTQELDRPEEKENDVAVPDPTDLGLTFAVTSAPTVPIDAAKAVAAAQTAVVASATPVVAAPIIGETTGTKISGEKTASVKSTPAQSTPLSTSSGSTVEEATGDPSTAPVATVNGADEPMVAATVPLLEAAPDLGIESVIAVKAPSVDPVPTTVPFVPVTDPAAVKPTAAKEIATVKAVGESAAPVATPETKKTDSPKETADSSAGATDSASLEIAESKGDAASGDAPKGDSSNDGSVPAAPMSKTETAATERPQAGADRPAVDRHLVVKQVADRIENLVASRPRDGVTIHLEPRDMGTVTMIVKGLSSALDVQIFASDDRVRQSLDTSRPELAQALAPRNIEIREMRVSTAPSGTTSGNAGKDSDGRPRQQSSPQQSFSGRPAKANSAPRAARRSGRGVDLLV